MTCTFPRLISAIATVVCAATAASAQPLGPFSWQLQPFCNVLTFNVTQQGSIFTLDGFDDLCGAVTRAPAVGVAFPNPDGTIGLGVVIVAPGGEAFHFEAAIALATVSGTWRGSSGIGGTLAFNSASGGAPRPPLGQSVIATAFGSSALLLGRRAQGTEVAPAAVGGGQTLASFAGSGFTGASFSSSSAAMQIVAAEDWTPTARGSQISFLTTPNGASSPSARMTINNGGNVGIGTTEPTSLLHVNGDVRIGSCWIETDGDIVCLSDARFKRDVRALPDVLDRLVGLQPVRYFWRADELPERGFDARESSGLVAQDVERVLPELVTTDVHGYKSVSYGKLPLLAIQAIKELKEKNDALEERLRRLEASKPSGLHASKP